jgi:hypothetical protein
MITPTCPSSSYVGYGAIRILPTFMIVGQSAGCAASISIDKNKTVQQLDYSTIKQKLIEYHQILKTPDDWLHYVSSDG